VSRCRRSGVEASTARPRLQREAPAANGTPDERHPRRSSASPGRRLLDGLLDATTLTLQPVRDPHGLAVVARLSDEPIPHAVATGEGSEPSCRMSGQAPARPRRSLARSVAPGPGYVGLRWDGSGAVTRPALVQAKRRRLRGAVAVYRGLPVASEREAALAAAVIREGHEVRRRRAARQSRPLPNRNNVAGSGTGSNS
jgi:hypothetical protein